MIDVVMRAVSLVLVVALGYMFKRVGWARAADFPMFTRLVIYVTLPCALATSFNEFEIMPQLLMLAVLGFGAAFSLCVIGWLMERRNGPSDRAFGLLNVTSFNVGAFATPYLAMIIGPHAIVYASIFDVGGAMSAAGIGYGWAMSTAHTETRTTPVTFAAHMLKSPVLMIYLFLVVFRLMGLRFPDPIIVVTSTIGSANTFLAMFMVGIGVEIRLHRSKYAKALKYLTVRYAAVTLIGVALWFSLPFEQEIRVIMCVILAAPLAAMTSAFTYQARSDVELSTFITSASVLVAIVAMPLIYLALS